jgi:hypothetical protein
MNDSKRPRDGVEDEGRNDAGESGGGAYPNPHSGKKPGGTGGFMGHGGQSEMPYHGTGQLGEQQVGDNNSPAAKAGRDGARGQDEKD